MAMFGVGTILLRPLHAFVDPLLRTGSIRFHSYGASFSRTSFCLHPTSLCACTSNKHKEVNWPLCLVGKQKNRISPFSSSMTYAGRSSEKSSLTKMPDFPYNLFPLCTSVKLSSCSYSSHAGGNQDGLQNTVSTVATADASTGKATDFVGNEWIDTLKDGVISTGKKVKEVSDEVVPYIQQLYDSHPYLEEVVVPVSGTLVGTILAWFVMPRILRKLHMYALQSPFSLLSRSLVKEQVPYEKSMWSALEDPARYLITFMAFSQLGVIIAPSTSQYLPQVWRGAFVLSFVWFLQRWKTNIFTSMASQATTGLDREKLAALEKMSSVGLLVLGAMAFAEACGVPLQSLLTIGGIGGVATAFASRDILGNLFSGLSLQFSNPFSIGDYIKAGSIEGQVVEMGLTTTSLLNPEKYPVTVPNSLFTSQMIVNKSRARWRAIVTKIPVRIVDLDKIPVISEEIKSMLRSNRNVFLEKDAPYCFLSRIDHSCAEITLGCSLKNMRKDELLVAEQEILLQAARIIKLHGVELGSAQHDFTSR